MEDVSDQLEIIFTSSESSNECLDVSIFLSTTVKSYAKLRKLFEKPRGWCRSAAIYSIFQKSEIREQFSKPTSGMIFLPLLTSTSDAP